MYFCRISRLQENGVYEHKVRTSLKHKGFGKDFDSKVDVQTSDDISGLSLNEMGGVYYTLMFLHSIAFIVFISELIFKKMIET